MNKNKPSTYTFIADFRGGTYCTQVQGGNLNKSLIAWTEKLKSEKKEIKYLEDKTIEELERASKDEGNQPALLKGLKNVWFVLYSTKQGKFSINIIQTQI